MAEVKPIANFVCIGTQKAGTTTLADVLKQHPNIFVPEVKETKYFLFEEDYQKGLTFYQDTYFSNYNGQKAIGEFDPDYMLDSKVAERLLETLGRELKLIVVLRNPATRAFSHYLMSRKKGIESETFEKALSLEDDRTTDLKTRKVIAYKERGMYGSQLEPFLKIFPSENFLFLLFERDIVQNLDSTVKKVQEFLNVEVIDLDTNVHSNEAGEAINENLRDLVRKSNPVKSALKKIIPSKSFRKSIRRFLIEQNKQNVQVEKPSREEFERINRQYFQEQISLTEKLTGLDLKIWK